MQLIRTVKDLYQLETEIARHRMSGYKFLYRGQSNASWPLQTTLSRLLRREINYDNIVWEKYMELFQRFKTSAIDEGTLSYKPGKENDDFFILTMLRHLGFPCNLLDWSASLHTAILFACSENLDTDGALWILSTRQLSNSIPFNRSPFEIDEPMMVCKEFDLIPPLKSISGFPLARLRRLRQSGFISIIPHKYLLDNVESLIDRNDNLCKIIIPATLKVDILNDLDPRMEVRRHIMVESKSDNDYLQLVVNDLSSELKSIITK